MNQLFLITFGLLVSLAQTSTALRGTSTRIFSTREADSNEQIDNEVLNTLNHYELHDFSSVLTTARRRLSDSEEHQLDLQILGRQLKVNLRKDRELFGPNYKHVYLDENGKEIKREGALDCIYRAELSDEIARGSFALCDERRILATVFGETAFTIEPVTIKRRGRNLEETVHAVYYHEDLKSNLSNMTRMLFPPAPEPVDPNSSKLTHLGTENFANAVGTPFVDSKTKYVGLLVVNDHAYYKRNGANTHVKAAQILAATKSYYDLIPSSATYRIQLNIDQMATFVVKDPYTANYNSNGAVIDSQLLGTFGAWLQSTSYEVDAALLLVGTKFSEAAGWGYVGTVCDRRNLYNVGETDGTMNDASVGIVAAHEIGHVLGSQHDDITVPTFGKNCNDNTGIMGRRRLQSNRFSTCTVEWFRLQFSQSGNNLKYNTVNNPACLEKVDYTIDNPQTPTCGDGLVEGDEECDCVDGDCSNNPCCNGSTCKLKAGATCAAHQGCCDPNTCNPRAAGFTCRASTGQCDLAETCTGNSPECPADVRKPIGTACSQTKTGKTISGACTCDGCMNLNEKCRLTSANYVGVCSWLSTGNDACEFVWCENSSGQCSGYQEPTPLGISCGTGKGCQNKKCVPVEQITCPGAVFGPSTSVDNPPTKNPTKAPIALTKAPSRQPTSRQPTSRPTKKPTKTPTKFPTKKKKKNKQNKKKKNARRNGEAVEFFSGMIMEDSA